MNYHDLPQYKLNQSDSEMVKDWLKRNKPLVVVGGVARRGKQIVSIKDYDAFRSKNISLRSEVHNNVMRSTQSKKVSYDGVTISNLLCLGDVVSNGKHRMCKFRCVCGTEKMINLYSVTSGAVKSCGCMRGRKKNDV